MEPKLVGRLAAALAALTAATILAAVLSRPSKAPSLAPAGLADKAARLVLRGPGGSLELKRDKDAWLASAPAGFPADGKLVREALGKLAESKLSEPLTEDPSRYALFGLGGSSPTHVTVYAASGSEPLLEIYVGGDGPDYPSAFVRRSQETAVLQASGFPASELARAPGDWLDKAVTPGPADSVTRLAVKGPKGAWELRRASATWLLAGKAIPAGKIDSVVRPLREAAAGLEAETVLDAAKAPAQKETGLDKPELRVELEVDGKGYAFAVGKKDPSGRRYVRKEGEARALYLCSDWKLDFLRKSAADLLK